ncbi:hypothetical protein LguiA_032162 [Lonicera macranthoides]
MQWHSTVDGGRLEDNANVKKLEGKCRDRPRIILRSGLKLSKGSSKGKKCKGVSKENASTFGGTSSKRSAND